MWFLVVFNLIDNEYASLLFSQEFFSNCFCILNEFANVFEKSDACKQLICIMQRVHFKSESVFSIVKIKISFLCKKQIESGLAWYIVLSTTIGVITVVKMLWTHEAQPSESATNFDHCDDAYRCR